MAVRAVRAVVEVVARATQRCGRVEGVGARTRNFHARIPWIWLTCRFVEGCRRLCSDVDDRERARDLNRPDVTSADLPTATCHREQSPSIGAVNLSP
jgi:hypothetical protein